MGLSNLDMLVAAYSSFTLVVGIAFLLSIPFTGPYPPCLPLSIAIGSVLILFAVLSIVAAFFLKSRKTLNYLFITQLAICFILIILALSVVKFRPFVKEMENAANSDEDIDKMHHSLKCCMFNTPGRPKNGYFTNSCCDKSDLKYPSPYSCPPVKAYEYCLHKFLDKQQSFKATAVICLTFAIIFQILLLFSFYNSQRDEECQTRPVSRLVATEPSHD